MNPARIGEIGNCKFGACWSVTSQPPSGAVLTELRPKGVSLPPDPVDKILRDLDLASHRELLSLFLAFCQNQLQRKVFRAGCQPG